jgi:hypothetical protein
MPVKAEEWENRNALYDGRYLHFKKCPRSFLKTDVPAKHPRTDCPFLAKHMTKSFCLLPSGMRYMIRMCLGEKTVKSIMEMDRICYLAEKESTCQ